MSEVGQLPPRSEFWRGARPPSKVLAAGALAAVFVIMAATVAGTIRLPVLRMITALLRGPVPKSP